MTYQQCLRIHKKIHWHFMRCGEAHYVTQTGLELLDSNHPPMLASWVVGLHGLTCLVITWGGGKEGHTFLFEFFIPLSKKSILSFNIKIDINGLTLGLLWLTAICDSLVEQNYGTLNSTIFHQVYKWLKSSAKVILMNTSTQLKKIVQQHV